MVTYSQTSWCMVYWHSFYLLITQPTSESYWCPNNPVGQFGGQYLDPSRNSDFDQNLTECSPECQEIHASVGASQWVVRHPVEWQCLERFAHPLQWRSDSWVFFLSVKAGKTSRIKAVWMYCARNGVCFLSAHGEQLADKQAAALNISILFLSVFKTEEAFVSFWSETPCWPWTYWTIRNHPLNILVSSLPLMKFPTCCPHQGLWPHFFELDSTCITNLKTTLFELPTLPSVPKKLVWQVLQLENFWQNCVSNFCFNF